MTEHADARRAPSISRTPRTPPKVRRPDPAPLTESPAIARLSAEIDHLDAGAARSSAVTEFLLLSGSTPLIEEVPGVEFADAGSSGRLGGSHDSGDFGDTGDSGDSADDRGRKREFIVTFLWLGNAEDVVLFVNRITDERDLGASLMRRVSGTDLWHLSYRMRSDWRAAYAFVPRHAGQEWPWADGEDQVAIRAGLDRGFADPRNPLRMGNRVGTVMSVVQMPDAPPQPWLARTDAAPRGQITAHEGPGGRRVWVYLSAGAGGGARADAAECVRPVDAEHASLPQLPQLPLVIVLDGDAWCGIARPASPHDLPATLDQLVYENQLPACVAIFVDSRDRDRRWAELGEAGDASEWVARELVAWARERWAVAEDPRKIVVAGQSLGAYTALRVALGHPAAVGAALAQSASLWQRELPEPNEAFVRGSRVYLEVGQQEWVLRDPNRELSARFELAGVQSRFVEYNGGHDYACWRGGIADGLVHLLGAYTLEPMAPRTVAPSLAQGAVR